MIKQNKETNMRFFLISDLHVNNRAARYALMTTIFEALLRFFLVSNLRVNNRAARYALMTTFVDALHNFRVPVDSSRSFQ